MYPQRDYSASNGLNLEHLKRAGPDTLKELRWSWAEIDDDPHVHAFVDMHDLGDGLIRAGFSSPVLDVERFVLTYQDLYALMRDLKALGVANRKANASCSQTRVVIDWVCPT
jgi:hypothetical protein